MTADDTLTTEEREQGVLDRYGVERWYSETIVLGLKAKWRAEERERIAQAIEALDRTLHNRIESLPFNAGAQGRAHLRTVRIELRDLARIAREGNGL